MIKTDKYKYETILNIREIIPALYVLLPSSVAAMSKSYHWFWQIGGCVDRGSGEWYGRRHFKASILGRYGVATCRYGLAGAHWQ